jgi:hypothetical protein
VALSASLRQTWTRPADNEFGSNARFPAGGFGDGYFLTIKPGLQIIELWQVDSPSTALDSFDGGATNFFEGFARNSVGDVYARRNSSTSTDTVLARITQSSGTLTVTDIGTWTADTSTSGTLHLSADDSEIVYHQSSPRRTMGLSTTDASVSWDIVWSSTSHNGWVVATPAPDRFICYCSTHTDYELWEGSTATLLDSMNDTYGNGTDVYPCSVGLNQVMWVEDSGTETHAVGLLDTSADTLAWAWGPTSLSTPGWSVITAIAEARGTLATIAPESSPADPDPAISFYIVDTVTGEIAASPGDTLIGQGAVFTRTVGAMWVADDIAMLGPEATNTSTWSSWTIATLTAPRLLRQRQSPKRTPSRVSYRVA